MTPLRSEILRVFYYRAPNVLKFEVITKDLDHRRSEDIREELRAMIKDGIVVYRTADNSGAGDPHAYWLSTYENVPVRLAIDVGGYSIPRVLREQDSLPESINLAIEGLANYAETMDERFRSLMRQETQAFYANVIVLFGVFISLFSMIFSLIPSLTSTSEADASSPLRTVLWRAFLLNLVKLAPMAIVLAVFTFVLMWISRNRTEPVTHRLLRRRDR